VAAGCVGAQMYGWVDKGAKNYQYTLLTISSITISISEQDYVRMRVDFIGGAETEVVSFAGTPPDIDCNSEFIASDCTFTIGGTAYPFKSFELTINNQLASNQHENAQTRSIFESEDLLITSNITTGWRTDTTGLYRRAVAGDDSATLVFTDGTDTYTFTFGNTAIPDRGPSVGSGEIIRNIAMIHEGTGPDGTDLPQISIAKS